MRTLGSGNVDAGCEDELVNRWKMYVRLPNRDTDEEEEGGEGEEEPVDERGGGWTAGAKKVSSLQSGLGRPMTPADSITAPLLPSARC